MWVIDAIQAVAGAARGIIEAVRGIYNQMPEQISALLLSGAAGAYVRAVFAPQDSWRRRIGEGIAGAFGAIFLGGPPWPRHRQRNRDRNLGLSGRGFHHGGRRHRRHTSGSEIHLR